MFLGDIEKKRLCHGLSNVGIYATTFVIVLKPIKEILQ